MDEYTTINLKCNIIYKYKNNKWNIRKKVGENFLLNLKNNEDIVVVSNLVHLGMAMVTVLAVRYFCFMWFTDGDFNINVKNTSTRASH